MFKLDNTLLEELGLGALPAEEKNRMLNQIYETLELRVGMKLAEQMTNEQLDEFESYIDRQDEAGALTWLETNFPNYKDVVGAELENLKQEVKTAAPQIIAAVTQAQAQNPTAMPQPQQQIPSADPYATQLPVNPAAQPYPATPPPADPSQQPYGQVPYGQTPAPYPTQPPAQGQYPDPAAQQPPQQYPPAA